jgi:hypothetical protein
MVQWYLPLQYSLLVVLTSYDQLLFILKIVLTFVTKQATLMRRTSVLNPPLQLVCAMSLFFFFFFFWLLSFQGLVRLGNTILRGRFSTIDLLIKVACFVKNNICSIKRSWSGLNSLVQGGQLYWAFPFSNSSLVRPIVYAPICLL